MAREKRALDNIEKDVIAAMQLGYGVHYGHYKADYPNTRDIEEPEVPKSVRREASTVCSICGKEFLPYHGNQKTCSKECQTVAIRNAARERHRRIAGLYDPATCPVCGTQFMRKSTRKKHCSRNCYNQAYYKQAKTGG